MLVPDQLARLDAFIAAQGKELSKFAAYSIRRCLPAAKSNRPEKQKDDPE
jgi:hypothetical protein